MTNNVAKARAEKGITQSELAIRAGIGIPHLCTIEKGAKCERGTQEKISKVLGIKVEKLFNEKE